MIFVLHGRRYAAPSFHWLTDRFKISLEKARLGAALMDWLVFGAYLTRRGVSSGCGENEALRDNLLNSFFDMMYAALRNAGMKELEFFEFEEGMRQRFTQYDSVMAEANDPLRCAASALSTNIFGETVEAAKFSMAAFFYSADTLLAIRDFFYESKIVN
jgi:hypothetical protein